MGFGDYRGILDGEITILDAVRTSGVISCPNSVASMIARTGTGRALAAPRAPALRC